MYLSVFYNRLMLHHNLILFKENTFLCSNMQKFSFSSYKKTNGLFSLTFRKSQNFLHVLGFTVSIIVNLFFLQLNSNASTACINEEHKIKFRNQLQLASGCLCYYSPRQLTAFKRKAEILITSQLHLGKQQKGFFIQCARSYLLPLMQSKKKKKRKKKKVIWIAQLIALL